MALGLCARMLNPVTDKISTARTYRCEEPLPGRGCRQCDDDLPRWVPQGGGEVLHDALGFMWPCSVDKDRRHPWIAIVLGVLSTLLVLGLLRACGG